MAHGATGPTGSRTKIPVSLPGFYQMNETPKRLAPTRETCRELFLKSGNLCAFPGCPALVSDEQGNFTGQICHIQAAEPGGARFNPDMTNEERRHVSNLMLMCYPHHQITNDTQSYSIFVLRDMKAAHERLFSGADRAMRERFAKLKWRTLVGAGAAAGISLDEFAHQVKSFLQELVGPLRAKRETPLRRDLERTLRRVQAGVVFHYSRDPLHIAIGNQLLLLFRDAGWQTTELDQPPRHQGGRLLDFDHCMLMLFIVPETEQAGNARKVIDDFFSLCGFSHVAQDEETLRARHRSLIRFSVPVVVHHKEDSLDPPPDQHTPGAIGKKSEIIQIQSDELADRPPTEG